MDGAVAAVRALIEIGDSKAAHQARCDWCGKFIGSTNPAQIIDVHSPDYFCEALDPDKLERLGRYEVHLDRKLERMLSMLLRLKDLRAGAVPV